MIDRGPYIKGRRYDLTYATAKALGTVHAGVATIGAVSLPTAPQHPLAPPSSDPARASIPLIAIDQAIEHVLDQTQPLPAQTVGIDEALDRVLARDVLATGDMPPFPCSAMDGYAMRPGRRAAD